MVTNPNFKPGVGRLVTDRYDFQKHIDGVEFRHNATETDIANPSLVPGGATTVESSLEAVQTFISAQAGVGEGFVTVGDGYDTWHAANGAQNYDPIVPSLDTLLNPIFQALVSGNPLSSGFERIQRGGIVVIKSGTYIVKKPIYVPAGITLLGEGYGTKIVNASTLNNVNDPQIQQHPISVSAVGTTAQVTAIPALPNLKTGDYVNVIAGSVLGTWTVTVISNTVGSTVFNLNNSFYTGGTISGTATTMCPIFIVLSDGYRAINDAAVDPNLFMFSESTQIMNMVISDNFVENPVIGSNNYKIPQNGTSSTQLLPPPLIQQTPGSNLVLDNVTIMGRVNFSSPPTVSIATGTAIELVSQWGNGSTSIGFGVTTAASGGTILKITECFIDGFSIPLLWDNLNHGADYLEITNSKVRGYGYYDGNGSFSTAALNNLFTVNDASAKITNNILYANALNIAAYVYLGVISTSPVPPNTHTRGRFLFANNDLIASQNFAGTINTVPVAVDSSVANTISTWLSLMVYGNNLQDTFITSINNKTLSTITAASTTISNPTILSSTLQVNSNAFFLGQGTFNGALTANNALTLGNNSELVMRGTSNYNITYVNVAAYTIDATQPSTGYDNYILVQYPLTGPCTITLPQSGTNSGRTLTIKDFGNATLTNTITIVPTAPDGIDGNTIGYVIDTAYASVTLLADGGSGTWYIV